MHWSSYLQYMYILYMHCNVQILELNRLQTLGDKNLIDYCLSLVAKNQES